MSSEKSGRKKLNPPLPQLDPEALEGFFNLSLDLLCIADLKGNFLLVNPEWENVLGYSLDALNGRSFLDFVHPEDMEATLDAMKNLAEDRDVFDFVNRYRAKDGSYRWIQWRSKPSGEIIYAAARDITQLKKQLLEVERLSNFFQQTNEVARVGGWEVDLPRGKVWWSDVTREIHECEADYEPQLEEGLNFYLEGEDRETIRREFERAAREGIPFDLELRIVTAKQRICWIRTVGKPVMENGKVIRVVGAFQDIDERKTAFARLQSEEAKLRGLFDLADVGIAMNDFHTGAFLMFNDKLIEPSGYTREEFLSLSYRQVTPEEYAEKEDCQLTQLKQTGRYGPYEKEYIRKDGSRYPVRLTGFLMKDDSGRDVIWSIVQDITEEKETEHALREAALKAEEANHAKSAFLATMSHEIRTPLNGVIGGTELLRTTQLSEEQENYVEMILHSGDLLLSTINDVLDYSKIESGRIDIESAPFDVIKLVEGLIDAVTPQVRQKGIDLVFFPSRDLPRHLVGDAVRLRQVLLNLLSNAVKFTESGYVEISISKVDGRGIQFDVEDTGIGIADERMAEIFLPFVQAESSTTRQFGGTGLGLSISHRLVSLMGGELDLESSIGHGTRFFFNLPLEAADVGDEQESWTVEASLVGKKVLLIEDTLINQKLLRHAFESAGARVTLVESWQEFQQADLPHPPFDLVVLDRFLTSDDSAQHLQAIEKKWGSASKVVMLASDTSGLPAGLCDAVFQKPIKATQLLSQCGRVLAGQTSRRASGVSSSPAVKLNQWSQAKVLVVEDNRLNQLIARTMLSHLGVNNITLANNGLEAVAVFPNLLPDLILMDCQMPKMDGYKATRCIREYEQKVGTENRVLIVGLSAAAIQGDRDRALQSGMDSYITKPLRPEDLQSTLEQFTPGACIREGADH